ncbi:MAG: ferredoxin family protein [Calditrichia bacterium]
MTYIITEPCEGVCNTACVEVCPVDCIYPPQGLTLRPEDKEKIKAQNEILYIHPQECIDCGACQPECPVDAIYPDDEVPDKWKHFIDRNYERFGLKAQDAVKLKRSDFKFRFKRRFPAGKKSD